MITQATDFALNAVPVDGFEPVSACHICGATDPELLPASPHLSRCPNCGYIFDNPRPTLKALVSFYSRPTQYNSWLSEERERNQLWVRRLRLLLKFRTPGSLLDVGTGIGQFLSLARPYFTDLQGTEVSKSAIEIARSKYAVNVVEGELEAIDFGSRQFDNITVFHVLEHLPNPRLLIDKCERLLSRRGKLVIAVPNDVISLRAKMARHFRPVEDVRLPRIVLDGTLPEIHLSHFTPRVIETLLEQHGLKVISSTLDPYYVAAGIRKVKHFAYYWACLSLQLVLRTNLYDTMLVVATKP